MVRGWAGGNGTSPWKARQAQWSPAAGPLCHPSAPEPFCLGWASHGGGILLSSSEHRWEGGHCRESICRSSGGFLFLLTSPVFDLLSFLHSPVPHSTPFLPLISPSFSPFSQIVAAPLKERGVCGGEGVGRHSFVLLLPLTGGDLTAQGTSLLPKSERQGLATVKGGTHTHTHTHTHLKSRSGNRDTEEERERQKEKDRYKIQSIRKRER